LIDGTTRYTGNTSLVLGLLILAIVLLVRKGPVDLLYERFQARRARRASTEQGGMPASVASGGGASMAMTTEG